MATLKIRSKLMLLLLTFVIAPLLLILAQVWIAMQHLNDNFMNNVQQSAETLSDVIDRNLFERYGDVQAFGYNGVAYDRNNWGRFGEDNPLIQSMNSYIKAYGLYKLSLLVDNEGRLLAVNTRDAKGKEIKVSELFGRTFAQEKWFTDARDGKFLLGKNGFTGTAVQQPRMENTVSSAYKGEDGYSIAFSAPVTDYQGRSVGVWVNFADFGLVEDVVMQQYTQMAAKMFKDTNITILDPQGTVLMDFDPTRLTEGKYRRDPQVVGQLNLVAEEHPAAVRAVSGQNGRIMSNDDARVDGFTHSAGAYDYPGLGWSVLVSLPKDQAFAGLEDEKTNIMISAAAIFAIVAAVSLWLGGKAVRPLQALTSTTEKLARGDNSVDIPLTGRGDEIGDMARAVQVFKENALKMENMDKEQQAQEARARQEKKQAMEKLAQEFEDSVKQVVDIVASAATEMDATSKSVASIAAGSQAKLGSLTSQLDGATNNVQKVAAATTELSSAIQEISKQVNRATSITSTAVEEASKADTTVTGLSEAAQRIGEVVEMINAIAAQINLLALNATIEAARAGDAGKGFAVVASEVKTLATETTKATEQIGQYITSIQGATGNTVSVIRNIGSIIREINHISTTIAAAVEEQGASTRDIASNVQQAAQSTEDVSRSAAEVSRTSAETGESANQMMQATSELSKQAETLRGEVDKFLGDVRAA